MAKEDTKQKELKSKEERSSLPTGQGEQSSSERLDEARRQALKNAEGEQDLHE